MAELNPDTYSSLEALGICTIDAGGETNIADLAHLYSGLDKQTFALCDRQPDERRDHIRAQVVALFMHGESGFENLILNNTRDDALRRFVRLIVWPQHLQKNHPDPEADAQAALRDYFEWKKAEWGIADFLAQCSEDETPQWLRDTCISLKEICEPTPAGNDDGGVPEPVDPVGVEPEVGASATF